MRTRNERQNYRNESLRFVADRSTQIIKDLHNYSQTHFFMYIVYAYMHFYAFA